MNDGLKSAGAVENPSSRISPSKVKTAIDTFRKQHVLQLAILPLLKKGFDCRFLFRAC